MTHSTPSETLVPIPRIGIVGLPGALRCLLLILAAAIPPLGSSAYLFGSAALPANVVEGVAIAALILMALYLFRTSGSAGGMLPLLIFATLLISFIFQSAIPAAIAVSLLFTVSEGGLLVATADRRGAILLPLTAVAGLALSVLLSGHWLGGLLCLLPFPIAVALGLGTRSSAGRRNGLTRVGVVCATTLVAGLTLVAIAACFLYQQLGSLDAATLTSMLDALREAVTSRLLSLAAEAGGTMAEIMTQAYVADSVNAAFNLLPGYLVAVLLVFVAIAQMILIAVLHAEGLTASLTERVRLYRISAVSDAVFLLAYVVSFVSLWGDGSLVGTVAHNLVIILQPGLALGGLLHIVARLTARGQRGGCAPLLLFIAPVLLIVAPTVLAIYEAILCLFATLRAHVSRPPAEGGSTDSDRGAG